MTGKWLTVGELAAALRVRESWVYTKASADQIPCLRVGRYLRFDLDAVLQALGWEVASDAR